MVPVQREGIIVRYAGLRITAAAIHRRRELISSHFVAKSGLSDVLTPLDWSIEFHSLRAARGRRLSRWELIERSRAALLGRLFNDIH